MKNPTNIRFPFLAIAVTTLLAAGIQQTSANPMNVDATPTFFTLVLTENSSTDLVVTSYNGSGGTASFSVTPNGSDNWTVTSNNFPTIFFIDFIADFLEPASEPNEVNEAYSGDHVVQHPSFTVESDVPIAQYQGGNITTFPNGGTSGTIGQDGIFPIVLQFNDNAAANEATVPEAGSTLTLLAMSSIGLMGIARFQRLRVV